jgi:two-component system, OmpR family, sensor histidine kinase ChvG
MEASIKAPSRSWRLIHSFSLKLFLLALILLSVPLILYWQFQRAEREQAALLHNAVDQMGRVIAAMLRPHFENFKSESPAELRDALAGAAIDKTNVKVLVRLAGAKPDDFVYIASAPPLSPKYLIQERRDLIQSGIFQRLAPTCDRATDLEVRFVNPAGQQEVLTSMTPVHAEGNCWIVITAQNAADLVPTPLHLSFWRIPAMPVAGVIYFLSAALIVWLFTHMWGNVWRFRTAARRIRMRGAGGVSFRELNTIPELTRVAEDFDSLVAALTDSQAFIMQTAEENSHALKAPLAVIAQSIEPLRRAVSPSDAGAQRSLQLIERSITRLDSLVSSTRDLEQAAAEAVYPVRHPIDLSGFLKQMLSDYDVTLAAQGKRIAASIAHGVTAFADEDVLEPVIENILENAASFIAKGETIDVTLEKVGELARIRVADRGPGVDPNKIGRIFDRYVSFRDTPLVDANACAAAECHQGLGLWIVKRNVEGLGGTVEARNRHGGGFEIDVNLKAKR